MGRIRLERGIFVDALEARGAIVAESAVGALPGGLDALGVVADLVVARCHSLELDRVVGARVGLALGADAAKEIGLGTPNGATSGSQEIA